MCRVKAKQKKSVAQIADPVFQKYGEPFLVNKKGSVALNDRAVAVQCATTHQVKFNARLDIYERYDGERGLWVAVREVDVIRMLDNLLLALGRTYDHQDIVARLTSARLSSLCKMMKPHNMQVEAENAAGLVHVRNGVVELGAKKPKLLPHDPKYLFRHSGEIVFNPEAVCPKFLKKFLGTALEQPDINLLQKYCGSMLLGPNTCHGIMVIRGTAGGGKSTLLSIVEKIIGENNVAHLRTSHLNGRFETSAFLGKRLLVGKDVPGDTLSVCPN